MENSSDHLINFDDDLLEFDPLSQKNSQIVETVPKEVSYSNDLLGFNSMVSNSASNQTQSVRLKPARAPPPPPNHATKYFQPTTTGHNMLENTSDFTSLKVSSSPNSVNRQKSAHDQTSKINKDRPSLLSYVSNSNKEKYHKSQSKFYDATQNNGIKTKPKSFVSYLPDTPDELDQSKTKSSQKMPEDQTCSDDIVEKLEVANLMGQKEELLNVLLSKRQEDYTSKHPFRIFVGTWNVNGQYPPKDIYKWTAVDPSPPDIYVIGFQELDLSKEAFVFGDSAREEEWFRVVALSLHPNARYELVKHIRLVGMMMLVFSAKQHTPHITHIQSHQVGTGLLGKMGNKGGVGIRFNLHSTSVCVVNSHLAAHAEMTQKRNEDYTDICSRMRFVDPDDQGYVSIFQHDVLIWLGDLNYRIDGMLPDMVKECIKLDHYNPLKESDQLSRQRQLRNVFHNFEEGPITFRPTYKYDPGTDDWDTSDKCRAPAWCDRILWREAMPKNLSKKNPVKSMELKEYRSHLELKLSDHKPVSALFDMSVKVVDQSRYSKVYAEELRHVDRMENDWLPTMTISSHSLEYGTVTFQKSIAKSVELQNTGQTPCHFEFIPKPGEPGYCKPWLNVSKPKGYVLPGEKIEIEFEVYINKSTVAGLNTGEEKIEDILILHLVGDNPYILAAVATGCALGKDFFITLSGRYLPSCFGTSLESLCRMKKPIRKMLQSELLTLSKISPMGSNKMLLTLSVIPIPKEIWLILDYLHNNALREPLLFSRRGLHIEFQEIREVLDTTLPPSSGSLSLPGSNHSVAECLLVFLETLPEPVIPFYLYSQCLEVSNDFLKCKQLLKNMSSCHFRVFRYLLSFLQELLQYQMYNGLSIDLIANIFSGLILRPSQRKAGIEVRIDRQRAKTFMENFLIYSLDDWIGA